MRACNQVHLPFCVVCVCVCACTPVCLCVCVRVCVWEMFFSMYSTCLLFRFPTERTDLICRRKKLAFENWGKSII